MGFDSCHPAIQLIFFLSAIYGAICFQHPAFLLTTLVCAYAYCIKRGGKKALVFTLSLLPCAVLFAFYYSSYHHFGMTVLRQNLVGNNMTVESFVYGTVLGISSAAVLSWLSCVYSVFTSDKVVYLFGKISPRLSLFLAILLRMVPRIKAQAKRIHTARKGIGRGVGQGNVFARIGNAVRIFSMLISWTIGSLATVSDSMRSRGSHLRGRTAFSIYRFDHRDRAFVLTMFGCLTLCGVAMLFGVTDTVYDPLILYHPIKGADLPYLLGYLLLLTMPLGLDVWTEFRFRRLQKTVG